MTKRVIDIEDLLIWAYRDQAVDEAKGHVAGPRVALMRWEVADDCLDVKQEVHPDAWIVHAAVRMLSRLQAGLVISCAKTRTRPDWMPGARQIMAAMVNGRGSPAKLYDGNRHVVGHKVSVALELEGGVVLYGMDGADIIAARKMYSTWREALVDLADKLSGDNALEAYAVGFPCALASPWRSA